MTIMECIWDCTFLCTPGDMMEFGLPVSNQQLEITYKRILYIPLVRKQSNYMVIFRRAMIDYHGFA